MSNQSVYANVTVKSLAPSTEESIHEDILKRQCQSWCGYEGTDSDNKCFGKGSVDTKDGVIQIYVRGDLSCDIGSSIEELEKLLRAQLLSFTIVARGSIEHVEITRFLYEVEVTAHSRIIKKYWIDDSEFLDNLSVKEILELKQQYELTH